MSCTIQYIGFGKLLDPYLGGRGSLIPFPHFYGAVVVQPATSRGVTMSSISPATSSCMPDDSPVYIHSFLDDNFLRKGFAVNRELSKKVLRLQNQCCYCGVNEKHMNKWTVSKDMVIERSMPMQIFVCPSNNKCTEKAYSEGYPLDRYI